MGKIREVDVYDKYYDLFRLHVTHSMGLRYSRISNNNFIKSFKTIKGICTTCGFPVSDHRVCVHKRFHIYFMTRFDMYEPFKDLIQAQYIRQLAIDLLNNDYYRDSLPDNLLLSAIESLILAEYMFYITLNIRYAADYQYSCNCYIDMDGMGILRYTSYGYNWLSAHLRALNIERTSVIRDLIKRYKTRLDDYDNWYYDLVGDVTDGD